MPPSLIHYDISLYSNNGKSYSWSGTAYSDYEAIMDAVNSAPSLEEGDCWNATITNCYYVN